MNLAGRGKVKEEDTGGGWAGGVKLLLRF